MSEHKDTLTKWLLGIAATATVGAAAAALTTWSDARALKAQVADLREAQKQAVSAERIARCEAGIENLRAEDAEIKESIMALWRVRGGQRESNP